MAITSLNPYLNFSGTAAQAIALYERVLGAKPGQVMRFGEVPGYDVPPADKDKVMHAELRIGDNAVLMVSDTPNNMPAVAGTNVFVALHWNDIDDMRRKFEALAEGGEVLMPLNDTFWGATFGMLVDRFGVRWMFNGRKPE